MNTNNIIIVILISVLIIMLFRNHITIIKPVVNPKPIGGCAGTRYGCCPNGVTARINPLGSNCYKL
jgi:hypothetical protein